MRQIVGRRPQFANGKRCYQRQETYQADFPQSAKSGPHGTVHQVPFACFSASSRTDLLGVGAAQKVRHSRETRDEHITVVGIANPHITFAIQGAARREHHARLFE